MKDTKTTALAGPGELSDRDLAKVVAGGMNVKSRGGVATKVGGRGR